jgi:ribosomal protein S18 acetylase RimI-like enzyme
MTGQVIQGFFIGGRMARPAAGGARLSVARATVQPKAAHAVAGPPPAAVAGPPQSPRAAAFAMQCFGGAESIEVDPASIGLVRQGGQKLLAKMEQAFRTDFSAVRVHVGPQAPRIGAIAFTTGNDVYFAPGQFQPDTIRGQQLIGHELAHVVQQRQGRVRTPPSGLAIVQDRTLEGEADRLGMQAAAHRAPVQAKMAGAAGGSQAQVHIFGRNGPAPGSHRLTAGAGANAMGSLVVHTKRGAAAEVTDLGVAPGYRDQGIGRQLLASAAQTGLRSGHSKLSLSAQDNGSGKLTRWYKDMGFQQVGVNGRGMPLLEAPIARLLAGIMQRKAAVAPGPPSPSHSPTALSGAQDRAWKGPGPAAIQRAWANGPSVKVLAPITKEQQAALDLSLAKAKLEKALADQKSADNAILATIIAYIKPSNMVPDGSHKRENYFMQKTWDEASLYRVMGLWNAQGNNYHSYAPNNDHKKQFHFLRPTSGRDGYNDNVHVFHD